MGKKTPAYAFWKIVEVGAVTGAVYMLLLGLTTAILFGAFNPIVILWPMLSGAIMGVTVGFSVAIPVVGLHLLARRSPPRVRAALAAAGGALGPLVAYQFVAQSRPLDALATASWILFLTAAALTALHYTAGLRRSEPQPGMAQPHGFTA